jgi:glycerophosphoryl diester phosphodiesterase
MKNKKRWFLLGLLGLPLGFIGLHLTFRDQPVVAVPLVVGHRGAASLAPENTLAAIEAGIAQGAGYVELDVQRSADGVVLILHDETLDRTTDGSGLVGELTWSAIQQLDAGSPFSAAFGGEAIPSLADVITFTAASATTLVLEIKSPQLYPGIEQQILEAVREFEIAERVMVISFYAEALQNVNSLAPDITTGFVWQWPRFPAEVASLDVEVVCLFWPAVLLNPCLVSRLHAEGYQVWVWTVNDARLMRLLLWLGVDGIATDRPDLWAK